MKRWKATFTGRPVNSLGLTKRCALVVYGNNEDEAVSQVYEKYEHISGGIELTPIREGALL